MNNLFMNGTLARAMHDETLEVEQLKASSAEGRRDGLALGW